jgi:topoisomerase-4 subunit A
VLATDAGYGFLVQLRELLVKNRNGKSCLKLTPNAQMLPPLHVSTPADARLACVTNTGRLLLFPTAELPVLARGKGNKLLNIPTQLAQQRQEYLLAYVVLSAEEHLIVHAGKRHLSLSPHEQAAYFGQRGQRGRVLPRGLQHVTQLSVKKSE